MDVDPSSLSFKESIMLFKQLYSEKAANTFLNAPRNKVDSKAHDNNAIPSGETV